MKSLGSSHPLVASVYFLSVILIAVFIWNPVIQLITIICGIAYSVILTSPRACLSSLKLYIPMFLLITAINPLFSKEGETVLFFLNDSPITLEAFFYGAAIASAVIGVAFICKCMNEVITEDKLIYLFAKNFPRLSLALSSSLRFIPLLKRQARQISRAQRGVGLYSSNSYTDKAGAAAAVFSVVITRGLEGALDASASMNARGYGTKKRSSFTIFRFTYRDALFLLFITVLIGILLTSIALGYADFNYYPVISSPDTSAPALIMYAAYFILAFLPIIIELKEYIKWKSCVSKI